MVLFVIYFDRQYIYSKYIYIYYVAILQEIILLLNQKYAQIDITLNL